MAELKTKEGELTTAELATFGILPKEPEDVRGEQEIVKPSTKNRVEGKFHEVKGKIKEEVGKATNDADVEASGKAEKNTGKVQEWIGRAEKAIGK